MDFLEIKMRIKTDMVSSCAKVGALEWMPAMGILSINPSKLLTL